MELYLFGTITVNKRAHDWLAHVTGQPEHRESSAHSANHAVGKLICSHAEAVAAKVREFTGVRKTHAEWAAEHNWQIPTLMDDPRPITLAEYHQETAGLTGGPIDPQKLSREGQ